MNREPVLFLRARRDILASEFAFGRSGLGHKQVLMDYIDRCLALPYDMRPWAGKQEVRDAPGTE